MFWYDSLQGTNTSSDKLPGWVLAPRRLLLMRSMPKPHGTWPGVSQDMELY
jgi:hypothetical protein